LLAETEGVFTETAGGVALGVTRKLIAQGRIQPDDRTVLVITGNGLKTQDALTLAPPTTIDPKLAAFDAAVNALGLTA
jgi:threonine synthase